jgi:hypothetical protein
MELERDQLETKGVHPVRPEWPQWSAPIRIKGSRFPKHFLKKYILNASITFSLHILFFKTLNILRGCEE